MNYTLIILTFFSLLLTSKSFGATSDWQKVESSTSRARLIATIDEQNDAQKGDILAGVEFEIESGWKMYGNDAGDIGLPPSFDFSSSSNYALQKIEWPRAQMAEEKFGNETLKYSFYKKHIIIPIRIQKITAGKPTQLNLNLNYALCKDVCVPASAIFSIKLDKNPDPETFEQIKKFLPEAQNQGLGQENSLNFYIIILAILGGLILNIMPCVLPVLSLKIISVLNHDKENPKYSRIAFASTCLGILFCFTAIALITIFIKSRGESFGWGLQFQNPYFLYFLIIVLVAFALTMLGKFELQFNRFLANFLNNQINHQANKIFVANFLSGILAVLLTTPCSAPLLGSAISFALTGNFISILTIFIAIGIGFSLPYIALTASPNLIRFLPKPGKWMIHVKKLMAFFLLATAAWIAYIAINNNSHDKVVISQNKNSWIKFDQKELQNHVLRGNVVIVDITADWCITCKFNKIRVLEDKELVAMIRQGRIIAMRADITKHNPEIIEFMRSKRRFAIPFNAVYGPKAKDGILTSEFLTKKELMQAINKAK